MARLGIDEDFLIREFAKLDARAGSRARHAEVSQRWSCSARARA
jgi:hypothetical protein